MTIMETINITEEMCVFQGDVAMLRMPDNYEIPKGWIEVVPETKGVCLAYGETSGHAHAFKEPDKVKVYKNPANDNQMIIVVIDNTVLRHEEHVGYKFPKKTIWWKGPQEEYTYEDEYRVVAD